MSGLRNFRDLVLESDYHALNVVGTKEVGSQNEMCLATTTLLVWVTDESPCEEMILLKDALVTSSNGCQVLLELRGIWGSASQVA